MAKVTAQSVTVLARTNMSEQGDPAIDEKSRVTRLLDTRLEQLSLAEQAENHLMQALWDLRGSYSLEDMVRWTGWSRQTIYNKWEKHGLEIKRQDNAKSRRDPK